MPETAMEDLDKLSGNYRRLIASQKTVLLSTVSADHAPEISYAPYVQDEAGIFYIFISDLARHTMNVMNNLQAALLFIRPESESANLFARERVVFRCRVEEVRRDDEQYGHRLDALTEKCGEIVQVLRTLPDFHLFALHPQSGQYVVGFGRAYAINISSGALSLLGPSPNNKATGR